MSLFQIDNKQRIRWITLLIMGIICNSFGATDFVSISRMKLPETTIIAPGDLVEVSVYEHPEMAHAPIPVAPDGKLYYPLIEPVMAQDRPLPEVAREIELKLSRFVMNPKVTVSISNSNTYKFVILGKANAPGVYPIKPGMRLLEAVGIAGGFTELDQGGSSLQLVNYERSYMVGENGRRLNVNFKKLIKEGDMSQNVMIMPGDLIYLASNLAKQVFVFGEVTNPRTLYYSEGLTLIQLMADRAYTNKANLKRVTIFRTRDDKKTMQVVDFERIMTREIPDVCIEPEDLVFVPPEDVWLFSDLFELAKRSFVSTYITQKSLDFYQLSIQDMLGGATTP